MDINELSGWGISKVIADITEQGFSYDEETGEVFFTTDDLENLNITLDEKLASLNGLYQKYMESSESLKKRADAVKKNAKTIENKAASIKKYIDTLMQMNNKEKFEYEDKKISYRKGTSLVIDDEKAVKEYINKHPEYKDKFLKFKEPELNKTEIKSALKTISVPGAKLVETKNIQIK